MNTRVLVIISLLVGIGAVLHVFAPPIFGVTPDLLLAMMFLGIMLFPKFQYVLLLSILSGFIAALTTTFPGGEIASMIEKPAAAFIFFGLFLLVKNMVNIKISSAVLTAIGTFVSGIIFLSIGLFVLGADVGAGFFALISAVVLPTTLINTIIMIIVYPVVEAILKRSQPISVT